MELEDIQAEEDILVILEGMLVVLEGMLVVLEGNRVKLKDILVMREHIQLEVERGMQEVMQDNRPELILDKLLVVLDILRAEQDRLVMLGIQQVIIGKP